MTCKNINCEFYKECHNERRRVIEALTGDTNKLATQYRLCQMSYTQNTSWATRAGFEYDHKPFWKEAQ